MNPKENKTLGGFITKCANGTNGDYSSFYSYNVPGSLLFFFIVILLRKYTAIYNT